MEFERVVNAGGPTGGYILKPSDNTKPKSVAIIQCVGARDEEYELYCCRYGCMAAVKQAYLIKEKLGPDKMFTYVTLISVLLEKGTRNFTAK